MMQRTVSAGVNTVSFLYTYSILLIQRHAMKSALASLEDGTPVHIPLDPKLDGRGNANAATTNTTS
jgi:hypothetical protein